MASSPPLKFVFIFRQPKLYCTCSQLYLFSAYFWEEGLNAVKRLLCLRLLRSANLGVPFDWSAVAAHYWGGKRSVAWPHHPRCFFRGTPSQKSEIWKRLVGSPFFTQSVSGLLVLLVGLLTKFQKDILWVLQTNERWYIFKICIKNI